LSGRRETARVVAFDMSGRLLLLHTLDLNDDPRDWWELPGGGVEPGETPLAAARREFAEETGIPIAGCPLEQVATFDNDVLFANRLHRLREHLFVTRLAVALERGPRSLDGPLEHASLLGQRWWSHDELCSSEIRLHPPQLRELLTTRAMAAYRLAG
jgi:8-oxo-dGTP pyrophosphatase MutT (NUDIX family)